MRSVSDESFRENQNTYFIYQNNNKNVKFVYNFMFNKVSFSENPSLSKTMRRNKVKRDRPQIIIHESVSSLCMLDN